MNPIAVACHRGSHGKARPSASRRINRQRMARSGNVMVARSTARSSSPGSAPRAYATTAGNLTSCNTHARSAAVTTSPMTQAHLAWRLLGFDGEDNEVADFVDDRAEIVAVDALRRLAQLLGALTRPPTAIQQGADVDHGGLWTTPAHRPGLGGERRGGAAPGRRAGGDGTPSIGRRPPQQHIQRRGADPRGGEPPIGDPGAHEVR